MRATKKEQRGRMVQKGDRHSGRPAAHHASRRGRALRGAIRSGPTPRLLRSRRKVKPPVAGRPATIIRQSVRTRVLNCDIAIHGDGDRGVRIRIDVLTRRVVSTGERESIGQVVDRVLRMLDRIKTQCNDQDGGVTEQPPQREGVADMQSILEQFGLGSKDDHARE
jgi:hypothetical protein